MKFINSSTLILCAALLPTSCSTIFHTDFESGTPGQSPLSNPPGPPAGDSISVGSEEFFFVSAEDAIAGDLSLSIRERPPATETSGDHIIFRTSPISDETAPIYITWQGQILDDGGMIVDSGVVGRYFGRVVFNNGQISMFDTPVGSYSIGDRHTVLISMFPDHMVYRLTVFGDASLEAPFAEANLRDLDGTPDNEGFVDVSVSASADQNRFYVMDDVTVSLRDPGD